MLVLILFICFIVIEVLESIREILMELDNKLTESGFLLPDNYGKFCVSLDEMMPDVRNLLEKNIQFITTFYFRVLLRR